MNPTTNPTDSPTPAQRPAYNTLAAAALQHYPIDAYSSTFIQHNAGIVFRVSAHSGQDYVLKLHMRVGEGNNPSAAQLEPGLAWLAALADATDIVVQRPIATSRGPYVAALIAEPGTVAIACTLQHWVDGRVLNGDFTLPQAQALGTLMAKLHAFSSSYSFDRSLPAVHHDTQALIDNVRLLHDTLPTALLSPDDAAILDAAAQQIADALDELGEDAAVWGPVHGDLHYDNVLIAGETLRPIDFTGLRLAHYLYDLGVTLYHTFYQGLDFREAFLTGYTQVYPLPQGSARAVEACIVSAAIDDLAWNATLPEQRTSSLFHNNLRDLIDQYGAAFVQGQRFAFTTS